MLSRRSWMIAVASTIAISAAVRAPASSAPQTARLMHPLSVPVARRADAPLIVTAASHVIVMEYEAWFGPNAVTFQPVGLTPRPLLRSADMDPVGGGYDSEDPDVIRTHVGLLRSMGVDAVTVELTNNVSCIFDTGPSALDPALLNPCGQATRAQNASFQSSMRQIAANDANIYTAWSALGTSLKAIPLLACQDNGCLTPYAPSGSPSGFGTDPCPAIPGMPVGTLNGNPAVRAPTSFERELRFFDDLITKHPNLGVIFEGKPLVLVFAPPGIDDNACMMEHLHAFLTTNRVAAKYTFRMVGGYFDTDSTFWNEPAGYAPHAPIPLASGFGATWWSWVDRLNARFGYFPSYSVNPTFRRVENLTASIAVAGQNGWGTWPAACAPAPPNDPPSTTCPSGTEAYIDDALRDPDGVPYGTFANFMAYARRLNPIFLIVHQFNEFALPDEGWNAQTTDDIEPANDGIGLGAVDAVRRFLNEFRCWSGASGPGCVHPE